MTLPQGLNYKSDGILQKITWDLTIQGIILTLILWITASRFDASEIITIVLFLTAMFAYNIGFKNVKIGKYTWAKLGAMGISACFAWYLLYMAENTRAGYYRFHILNPRIQSIISRAPFYIVVSDTSGNIVHVSSNIKDLTGYSAEELIGKPVTILMRDGPARRHQQAFNKAVDELRDPSQKATGWHLAGDITVGVKRKDGKVSPVRVFAGGIRWSGDVQFEGDTDMFAVMTSIAEKPENPGSEHRPIHVAPPARPIDNGKADPPATYIPIEGIKKPR